jgi:hypothetical protein
VILQLGQLSGHSDQRSPLRWTLDHQELLPDLRLAFYVFESSGENMLSALRIRDS